MKRFIAILILLPLLAGFAPPEGPTIKGNRAYEAGKFDDAVNEYSKALEENPGKAEAHYNLGNAYYKKEQYDKALGEFREAMKIDPEMADAHYNAGNSLYRLGEYERALEEYKRADEIRRKDEDTVHNIEIVSKRIAEKKQEQQQKSGDGEKKEEPGAGKQEPQAGGQGSDDKKGQGEGGSGPGPASAPPLGEDELRALLEKQADEEKRLQRFFRPGRKAEKSEVDEAIEQMLRDFGFKSPTARAPGPGEPYVEKDW